MIRRWLRSIQLPTRKICTCLNKPTDLEEVLAAEELPIPESWGATITGRPLPNIVAIVRAQRAEH